MESVETPCNGLRHTQQVVLEGEVRDITSNIRCAPRDSRGTTSFHSSCKRSTGDTYF
jgi:hypothetical protein